jgi:hypothetical protein
MIAPTRLYELMRQFVRSGMNMDVTPTQALSSRFSARKDVFIGYLAPRVKSIYGYACRA